nr:Aminotransferase class V pyridoxal phosphate binding site [Hymenolepis microstoma]
MGAAASSAKRAVKNWNATNRAIKHLDKEARMREKAVHRSKITPKQQGENHLLHAKNDNLEKRVSSFDIKSEGVKKTILPEVGSPIPDPRIEFGFVIPDVIPKGKITISQAINMIKCYQLNVKTIHQLSEEYDLDPQIVTSICKYFTLFECESARVWVPPSKSTEGKTLLDEPIYQEDERITDDGVSRYIRLHELESPVKA